MNRHPIQPDQGPTDPPRGGPFAVANAAMAIAVRVAELGAQVENRAEGAEARAKEAETGREELEAKLAEAKRDPLTFLHTRRGLEEIYPVLLDARPYHLRIEDAGIPPEHATGDLSLILLDVDNFKDVNDTHGHREGDRVLLEVANAMRNRTRAQDFLARYGGDEFAILLPRTLENDARKVAQDIIDSVAANGYVTLSAGVVSLGEHDSAAPLDDSVEKADVALYRAKDEGRNQAVIYTDDLPKPAQPHRRSSPTDG